MSERVTHGLIALALALSLALGVATATPKPEDHGQTDSIAAPCDSTPTGYRLDPTLAPSPDGRCRFIPNN